MDPTILLLVLDVLDPPTLCLASEVCWSWKRAVDASSRWGVLVGRVREPVLKMGERVEGSPLLTSLPFPYSYSPITSAEASLSPHLVQPPTLSQKELYKIYHTQNLFLTHFRYLLTLIPTLSPTPRPLPIHPSPLTHLIVPDPSYGIRVNGYAVDPATMTNTEPGTKVDTNGIKVEGVGMVEYAETVKRWRALSGVDGAVAGVLGMDFVVWGSGETWDAFGEVRNEHLREHGDIMVQFMIHIRRRLVWFFIQNSRNPQPDPPVFVGTIMDERVDDLNGRRVDARKICDKAVVAVDCEGCAERWTDFWGRVVRLDVLRRRNGEARI